MSPLNDRDTAASVWPAHGLASSMIKEEGKITSPFDMTVLKDLDRFDLVMGTVDRVPEANSETGAIIAGPAKSAVELLVNTDADGRG